MSYLEKLKKGLNSEAKPDEAKPVEKTELSGLENLVERISRINLEAQGKVSASASAKAEASMIEDVEINSFKLISPIFFTGVGELLLSREIPKAIEQSERPLPREIFKRVLKEIRDINDDFFNLRTVIIPDPDDDINIFYFTMIPNDGLYCHLPLIGRIIIPQNYPTEPPVFHLLTRTNRSNVDVFSHNASAFNKLESSMCFDILKKKSDYGNASAWNEEYTLSSVISALMQSIVSFTVPQMYGEEQQEFVTMESLEQGYKNVQNTIQRYTKYIGHIPEIPANLAVEQDAVLLDFPRVIRVEPPNPNYKGMFEFSVRSQGFSINENTSFTCGFDLNSLTPNYVFSVVLTTNPDDLTGRTHDTILFRNGVTGSAAIKTKTTQTKWFYHGKPLNQTNLKLTITITNDQLTMAYKDISTKDKWIIHGDYPVAYLDNTNTGYGHETFYLVLYFKRKNGSNTLEIDNIYPEKGLIYQS
jgi:ubiquitin-protein ligase